MNNEHFACNYYANFSREDVLKYFWIHIKGNVTVYVEVINSFSHTPDGITLVTKWSTAISLGASSA